MALPGIAFLVRGVVSVVTRGAASALSDLGQQADETGNHLEDLNKQAEEAERAIDDAGKSADDASKQIDKLDKSTDEAGKSLDDAGKSAIDAGKAIDKLDQEATGAGKSLDDAAKNVDEAHRYIDALEKGSKEAAKALEEAEKGSKEAGQGLGKLGKDAGQAAKDLTDAEEATERTGLSFQGLLSAAQAAGTGIAGVFGPVFAVLSGGAGSLAGYGDILQASFAKIAEEALLLGMAMDSAIQQFKVATGAGADEAERFQGTIEDLAKNNTNSLEDLGTAATKVHHEFGALGDQMGPVTQIFLDFAKVTKEDTPEAIEQSSRAMKAWGISVQDAAQFTDILTAAYQKTGVPVSKLLETLSQGAPVFQTLGFSVEQTVATLAEMERQGISTTDTLGSFTKIIEVAKNPTEDQKSALKSLGIALDDLGRPVGDARGLFDQLFSLFSSGQLSSEQMASALEILGDEGIKFGRGLGSGKQAVDDLKTSLENSTGTVATASREFDQQLGEKILLLKRKYWEPFVQALGTLWLGFVKKALENLGPLLAGFSGMVQRLPKAWALAWEGMVDLVRVSVDEISKAVARMVDTLVALIGRLPGQIRGNLGTLEQDLIKFSSGLKRREQTGKGIGFDRIAKARDVLITPDAQDPGIILPGEEQDVLARKPNEGPIKTNAKPSDGVGTGGGAGGSRENEARLDLRLKRLENEISLERISKAEGVNRLKAILVEAEKLGISEDKRFAIKSKIHGLEKEIAREAEAAAKKRDAEAKKAQKVLEDRQKLEEKLRLETIKATEDTLTAKLAALDAEYQEHKKKVQDKVALDKWYQAQRDKIIQDAADAEAKKKADAEQKITDATAKARGQERELAIREIERQVEAARAAGVEEVKIREFIVAKKKELLKEEERAKFKGESGFDFSTGNVSSVEDAFKSSSFGKSALAAAREKSTDLTDKQVSSRLDRLAFPEPKTGDIKRETSARVEISIGGQVQVASSDLSETTVNGLLGELGLMSYLLGGNPAQTGMT